MMASRIGLSIVFVLALTWQGKSQGCVAVRNVGIGTNSWGNEPKSWQFSANYRFFHSYKHFVGSVRQKHREEEHTNVINNDHSVVLSGSYWISAKWNVSIAAPLIFINRSSLYEHYGNSSGKRFSTNSMGLGDIRLQASYLLLDLPMAKMQGGLGVKLPTGNYNYKDSFHKLNKAGGDSLVNRVVDQSIQPGDGGWGFITNLDGSLSVSSKVSLYWSGMYLFNPGNTNGIERSPTLTKDALGNSIPRSNQFSIADQYFARLGARVNLADKFLISLGGRVEGIPSKDLIGEADGFRRPGYVFSMDPSFAYIKGNHAFGLNLPVALVRNRTRSQIDILRGNDSEGKPIHGDAAFADFLVSVSYSFRLPKKGTDFGQGTNLIKK